MLRESKGLGVPQGLAEGWPVNKGDFSMLNRRVTKASRRPAWTREDEKMQAWMHQRCLQHRNETGAAFYPDPADAVRTTVDSDWVSVVDRGLFHRTAAPLSCHANHLISCSCDKCSGPNADGRPAGTRVIHILQLFNFVAAFRRRVRECYG